MTLVDWSLLFSHVILLSHPPVSDKFTSIDPELVTSRGPTLNCPAVKVLLAVKVLASLLLAMSDTSGMSVVEAGSGRLLASHIL